MIHFSVNRDTFSYVRDTKRVRAGIVLADKVIYYIEISPCALFFADLSFFM